MTNLMPWASDRFCNSDTLRLGIQVVNYQFHLRKDEDLWVMKNCGQMDIIDLPVPEKTDNVG
jgi:hypothetical protein